MKSAGGLGVWARRSGLVIFGIALAFAAGELVLHVMDVSYPVLHGPDDERGWAPIPGAEGLYLGESTVYVRMNGSGYRDRDHDRAKPPGVLRIAVLGDSYSEALQVQLEATYWTVVEQEMQRCTSVADRRVEVMNFGVSAYGTAQELLTLRDVWPYSPDLVVLLFTNGNDVRDNYRPLRGDLDRPYFIEDEDRIVLDDSFRRASSLRHSTFGRLYYWFLARSRVLQVLHAARGRALYASPPVEPPPALFGGVNAGLAFSAPVDPESAAAWRITERLVLAFRDEVVAHRAEFLLVLGSAPAQVHPDREVRRTQRSDLGVDDLLYSEKRLSSFGELHGFSVLALAPELERYVESTGIALHGFDERAVGHWNEAGHREAGRAIARRVCDELAGLRR